MQAVGGGEKGDGERRGSGHAGALGHGCDHGAVDGDVLAKTAWRQTHHGLAKSQIRHPGADSDHFSSAFTPQGTRGAWVLPQGVEHIAEVQPGCQHANFHVVIAGRATAAGLKGQLIQRARCRHDQLGRWRFRGCHGNIGQKTRHAALATVQDHLRFGRSGQKFCRHLPHIHALSIAIDAGTAQFRVFGSHHLGQSPERRLR